MAKRVSSGSVKSQLCTDADPNDHEAQLVIQAISQYPPQVIFNHRKDNREQRHRTTDPDQFFGAMKTTCQCVHGQLSRERT